LQARAATLEESLQEAKETAMPLYEYECSACHRRTEKIQKFSDAELTVCPHCGGALERTITAPSFQFAGGGWYKDGYGSNKPTDTGAASSAAPETSTAAKPAESTAAPAAAAPAATPAKS
jgi:putative FmdB family regulatory protein